MNLRLNYFRSINGVIAVADKVNVNGDIVTVTPANVVSINDDHTSNGLVTIESFGFRAGCHGQSRLKSLPIIVDDKEVAAEDASWQKIITWKPNQQELIKMQNKNDELVGIDSAWDNDESGVDFERDQASENLLEAVMEQKEMKLTSDDIEWQGAELFAVVAVDTPVVYKRFSCNYTPIKMNCGGDGVDFDGDKFNKNYFYIIERNKPQLKYTPEMQLIKALPLDGMLARIEYMCQSRDKLVIDTVTFKFEGKKDYCALDEKGYCFGIEKEHFIAWHAIDERSDDEIEMDNAKAEQIKSVADWLTNKYEWGEPYAKETAEEMQEAGLLAEIILPLK